MERLRGVLETGKPDRFEYNLQVAMGLRWFSADAVRVPNRRTVVFLIRDITQHKLMEQRLLQADRLAAMGTLASGVAHEVNNPLSYISSNLNFIAEGVALLRQGLKGPLGAAELARLKETMEDCVEALSEAQEGASRIQRLTGNLRTFARGNTEARGRANVRRALEASLGITQRELSYRARLVRHLEEVPEVSGSEARLEQVFLNLLINAVQAIPEGAPERNEVRVRLFTEQGKVVVEIRDTGAGMSEEMLKHVFEPFFSTRPVGAGTGLGLSISHGIIHNMGGEISAESTVGRGTCFRVRLLALPESEQAETAATAPTNPT